MAIRKNQEKVEDLAMKNSKLLVAAVALGALSSLPLLAQRADGSAQQDGSVNAASSHASESANGSAGVQATSRGAQVQGSGTENGTGSAGVGRSSGSARESATGSAAAGTEMRPVNGELVGKLDSKSAKEGDPVVVKTTQSTKTADGTVIPKGSRLVGHVTSVQAHGKGSAGSQMGIQFDRAELKGGQSLPIRSEIRSIAPPATAVAAGSMEGEDTLGGGGGMVSGGGRALGSARGGGGGLLGGSGGAVGGLAGGGSGAVGGLASSGGRVGSGLDSTVGETSNASGRLAGDATGSGGRLAGGAAEGVTAHETGVRGVMLAGDATGRAAGTLSASKQNIHLDGGTQMVLGVAAAR
jgi:hypothetical protein